MTARLLLARQMAALKDVEWTVVSGDGYEDAPGHVTVEVVPMRREFSPSDVPSFVRLFRLFRKNRFDFVQTHTPKPSFLGLPAARLSGTPAIYTIHGSLYFKGNGSLANLLGWCFERWCCAWANRVLVQSREDQSVLPQVKICPARKLSYLGNGIATEHFTEKVEPASLGTGDDLPVVLMVSRLVREKGCHDFVQLAESLSGKARFVHVGPAEDDQSDALSASELSSAARSVTFVGAVTDVRPYYAAADIVVLPSYREGIPRAVMEAAAAGRPVAAYDIRGVREVVEPESGLLVPRGDVKELTTLVAELIADPEHRTSLGRRCQSWVLERFSEDAVVERARSLYAELCPDGTTRSGGAAS
jgi:glycosyltransferase involved in cell wall biosynthesis